MQRCEECGYTYDLEAAPQAREAIRAGTAQLAGLLTTTEHDALARRPAPGVWAPLEYACHLRDMLLTQRERVLLARRVDTPQCVPMGRDERVGHEGYVEQDPVEVAAELTMAARLLGNAFGPARHHGLGAAARLQLAPAPRPDAALGGRAHAARGTAPSAGRAPSARSGVMTACDEKNCGA